MVKTHAWWRDEHEDSGRSETDLGNRRILGSDGYFVFARYLDVERSRIEFRAIFVSSWLDNSSKHDMVPRQNLTCTGDLLA